MEILVPFVKEKDCFNSNQGAKLTLLHNNWDKEFPYSPEVRVKLWHNSNSVFLKFNVTEKWIRGLAANDNEKVAKDSCVEFFISFDEKGYYNIEVNCIGTVLVSHREGRKINVEYASPEILALIKRDPSLGRKPLACKESNGEWNMTLEIPVKVFFKNDIKNLKGLKARCNIYKCGDELPEQHYLSLFPIRTPSPDFHRPEFFGDITFQA